MEPRKRVNGFKFPQIYRIFHYIDQYNCDERTFYVVQDLPPDRFEDAIDFLIKYFLPFEAMNEHNKILENPEAVEEYKTEWRYLMNQHISLVCFKENCSDIVGLNILFVKTRDTEIVKAKEPVVRIIQETLAYAENKFNAFDHYNVDEYLCGHGLAVDSNYHGRRIATEILKARIPLMKTMNLTLTTTSFTSTGAQYAAKNAGYKEDLVLVYEDLVKENPLLDFKNIRHKYYKVLSYKI